MRAALACLPDLLAKAPSRAAAAAATRGGWLVWSLQRSQLSPFASLRALGAVERGYPL